MCVAFVADSQKGAENRIKIDVLAFLLPFSLCVYRNVTVPGFVSLPDPIICTLTGSPLPFLSVGVLEVSPDNYSSVL